MRNKEIKDITEVSAQDKNALENLNYQNLTCSIDFKNLLVKKPWGSEYLLFENKFCAIWILNINYMENTSMHCHPQKDTSLVCLDGEVSCNTLNESYKLSALDGIFLNKKIFHQTQSTSKQGSFILEIETPVNKFDLVRINDTYGRQGKEYESKENYSNKANLTLNLSNNTNTLINNTQIDLLNISNINQLNLYNNNSIIAILSDSLHCGKIFKLQDILENYISPNTLVLIISKH